MEKLRVSQKLRRVQYVCHLSAYLGLKVSRYLMSDVNTTFRPDLKSAHGVIAAYRPHQPESFKNSKEPTRVKLCETEGDLV